MKLIETSEELGLQVIPLVVGEKKPAVKGWSKKDLLI